MRRNISIVFMTLLVFSLCQFAIPVSSALQFNDFGYTSSNGSVTIISYAGSSDNVVIPQAIDGMPVTIIGEYAFSKASFSTVILPDSIVEIGWGSFSHCQKLMEITIPRSVIKIAPWAFHNCPQLVGMEVNSENPVYSSLAGVLFDKKLTELIKVPGGMTGMYSVPETVVKLWDDAFAGSSLSSVVLPASVTQIDERSCFYWSLKLTDIITDVGNPAYSSYGGVLFDKSGTKLVWCPGGKTDSYSIPYGVAVIGSDAFRGSLNLKSIKIPGTVTSIGESSFRECYGLTAISFPASINQIGEQAFSMDTRLKAVYFLGDAPGIGTGTFANCAPDLKMYYLAGKSGFSSPVWNGYPADVFTQEGYLYDTDDPGDSFHLPIDRLNTVTDQSSAVGAIASVANLMTDAQKQSASGIDKLMLFSEEAIARAASRTVQGSSILISQGIIQGLQPIASGTKQAAVVELLANSITPVREMDAGVKFITKEANQISITIDSTTRNTNLDSIRVETPTYGITFSSEFIRANSSDMALVVTVTESEVISGLLLERFALAYATKFFAPPQDFFATSATTAGKTYEIKFNKPIKENITISLHPVGGEPEYQAITRTDGTAVGGKFNPASGLLDVKIKDNGRYSVKMNQKDFSDIQGKSDEMQKAIRILASKGIIGGTSGTTFSPESPITRAEIAALIVRTLSKLDPDANGGFTDVRKTDWFYGASGSAKRYGIMNGTSIQMFAPKVPISKGQIVAVAARTIRNEMRYINPSNTDKYLTAFHDYATLPSWGTADFALALRENLIVKQANGLFEPSGQMTRGDAAIILFRMFMRIW